ncbi:MAG TPA: bifunctional oligoribonuclease/PAP phosphatase NrnA [Candidatus Krumholzibacteria bacterium]|nr:bifunctional oligoribonuclease/PAP phosphatase NrnA [Candidatus Krumholzibacteria bacterium]
MAEIDIPAAAARFRALVQSHHRIWVSVHESPDGDSIGAALALQEVLGRMGKRIVAIRQHPFPRQYEDLPGTEHMGDVTRLGELFPPEVIIAVDVGSFRRIHAVLDHVSPETVVVNIDHHPGNGGPERPCEYVDLADPSVASTTMLTYLLLREAWPGCVTSQAATCLYVGLITDTGCFRFSNTNAETLRVGAELVALGADPGRLAENYMFRRRPQALRLLGEVLTTLEFHAGGKLSTLCLTRDMLERSGARMEESEGFVNHATSVDGVQVAAMLREVDSGRTRVSLRSPDLLDVSRIAREFGGGGHRNAAGCSVDADIDRAQELIVQAVLQALRG